MEDLRNSIKRLGHMIDAPERYLTIHSARTGDGTPHVEIHGDEYHYVVTERGSEFSRSKTNDLNELLYWIFGDVTFSMACDYELENRVPHQDPRRLIFDHQLKLLKKLDEQWARKKAAELEDTLKENPYSYQ